ncbi:MAG: hypothetical protein GY913_32845 [Proteobacteria bacterium]|nr:hypothetical protein [Pseudomonadota bacterium]MCP4921712.1 hypothetical protein [Pseudomonadota bacterium]
MSLVDAVQALIRRLQDEETLEPGVTEALLERIGLEASALAPDEVRELQHALRRFERAVSQRQHDVEAQLDHSGRGRRAMKGYGYLRSHKSGQRIRKKA